MENQAFGEKERPAFRENQKVKTKSTTPRIWAGQPTKMQSDRQLIDYRIQPRRMLLLQDAVQESRTHGNNQAQKAITAPRRLRGWK